MEGVNRENEWWRQAVRRRPPAANRLLMLWAPRAMRNGIAVLRPPIADPAQGVRGACVEAASAGLAPCHSRLTTRTDSPPSHSMEVFGPHGQQAAIGSWAR